MVVDAPAYVFGIGLSPVAPPCVAGNVGVEAAPDVHPADVVYDAGQPGAFFGQKAGVFLVAALVFEVDVVVGDVPVATDDDVATTGVQFGQHGQKGVEKAVFGSLPIVGAAA